jgi:hypothetical protein
MRGRVRPDEAVPYPDSLAKYAAVDSTCQRNTLLKDLH